MTRSHADPHLSRSAPWNQPSCLTQRFPLLAQAPFSPLRRSDPAERKPAPARAPRQSGPPRRSPPEVAAARREAPQSSSHRSPSPRLALTGGSWAAPARPPSPRPWRAPARPSLVPPGPSAEPGLGHVAMATRPRAALPRPLWGQRRDKQRREALLRPARPGPGSCPAPGWLRSAGWRPRGAVALRGACTEIGVCLYLSAS